MKTAAELYPELVQEEKDSGYFFGTSDYEPILREFGEILIKIDDDGHHGDSRVFYLSNGKYGILQFGWGSCSGCDALQGCETIKEIDKLMQELYASIKWFDSRDECLNWIGDHDWEGDFSWYTEKDKQQEFIDGIIAYLSNSNNK